VHSRDMIPTVMILKENEPALHLQAQLAHETQPIPGLWEVNATPVHEVVVSELEEFEAGLASRSTRQYVASGRV